VIRVVDIDTDTVYCASFDLLAKLTDVRAHFDITAFREHGRKLGVFYGDSQVDPK
jgi:hypothetical protein